MLYGNNGLDKDSDFYYTLLLIEDFELNEIFLILYCTFTITSSVENAVALSYQKCIYLPVAFLKPPEYHQESEVFQYLKKKL